MSTKLFMSLLCTVIGIVGVFLLISGSENSGDLADEIRTIGKFCIGIFVAWAVYYRYAVIQKRRALEKNGNISN